ncbi:MAG: hypothetical protein ACSHX7_12115 [Luteolibacter sp.]
MKLAEATNSGSFSRYLGPTGVIYDGLSNDAKQLVFTEHRQPRSKGKPVIRNNQGDD